LRNAILVGANIKKLLLLRARVRDFFRNAEVSMNCGFLVCALPHPRLAAARGDCKTSMTFPAGRATRQASSQMQNFLRKERSDWRRQDVLSAKTHESVACDSGLSGFRRTSRDVPQRHHEVNLRVGTRQRG
jgi:hypothetical protein